MSITHYCNIVNNVNKITPATMVKVFELGECENCGGPVQEVNAHGMRLTDAESLGLIEWQSMTMPPEVRVMFDDGGTGCDNC